MKHGVDLEAAAEIVRDRAGIRPGVLLVLGSGLGGVAGSVEGSVAIPFRELPGLPPAGVAGHAGRFVAGALEGVAVLVQSGRHHLYEGRPPDVVTAPVRIAARAGVETVIVTNASGGIRRDLGPGSLLLLDDQLDRTGRSPLVGPVRKGEERFPDMSAPYDAHLQRIALEVARERRIRLHRGTYAALTGPSYETPAEIRMLERMGADVVGMSTVPEVLVARSLGLPVLGLSLVTNRAAGLTEGHLSHREVVEVADRSAGKLKTLVLGVLRKLEAR